MRDMKDHQSVPVLKHPHFIDQGGLEQIDEILKPYVQTIERDLAVIQGVWHRLAQATVHHNLCWTFDQQGEEGLVLATLSFKPVADDEVSSAVKKLDDNVLCGVASNGQTGLFIHFLMQCWATIEVMRERSNFKRSICLEAF